jgi:hypothetical protein
MGFDYACSEKRRTKKDLRKKRKNRAYKHGGQLRSINLEKAK